MLIVVMGVCGCGKSTVGQLLAQKLNCEFADADDYHVDENKQKMAKSIPLSDSDREPWLISLHALLSRWSRSSSSGVLACSALRQTHRDILRRGLSSDESLAILFVYMRGSFDLINRRLNARTGHYMSARLLQSQIDVLEEPGHSESHVTLDVERNPSDLVNEVMQRI